MWAEEFAERLVVRMRQISRPVRFAKEGYDKTVGKSLLKIFHADIGTPLEIVYRIDLVRQRTESSLDLLDLFFAGTVLELEQNDVAQNPARHFGIARRGGFALGDVLSLVNTDTAAQNYRPGSQTQTNPYHVSLPPFISNLFLSITQ